MMQIKTHDYQYEQLPDLAIIRTQMTNPQGQNVRGGRSHTCNKDGLTRKKKRDPVRAPYPIVPSQFSVSLNGVG